VTIITIRLWPIAYLLIFAAPVYGTNYTNNSGADKTIRSGIFLFNPISYIDKDESAMDLNPDLLREVFRDQATCLAFVPGNWTEGLERLENQEIDLMMAVAYSDERAKDMDYGHDSVLQLRGRKVDTRGIYSYCPAHSLALLGFTAKEVVGESLLDFRPPGEVQDVPAIHHAGSRVKDLVKQILAFSRQSETSRILLQPAHIIGEALKILLSSLPTTIEILKDIEHTDDAELADPSQLSQIFMKLCTGLSTIMTKEKAGVTDIREFAF